MSGGEPTAGAPTAGGAAPDMTPDMAADMAPDMAPDMTPDGPPVASTPLAMLGKAGAVACEGDACIIPPSSDSSAAEFSPAR